jgi:hypothetical protein
MKYRLANPGEEARDVHRVASYHLLAKLALGGRGTLAGLSPRQKLE